MAAIDQLCQACRKSIENVFNPNTGSRQSETIAGDLFFNNDPATGEPCYVRDEIRFLNSGRLIFTPSSQDRDRKGYAGTYYVVCRKLTVIGGHKPLDLTPCGPDDPGSTYAANNVIVWQDRLVAAHAGLPPSPFQAGDGPSHNRNSWSSSNNPNGSSGADGGNGNPGASGSTGSDGIKAPSGMLLALEVEISQIGDHLTIDFDGQTGGQGGRGQNGGGGGNGMGGRIGESDTTWPGTGCDREPGSGGDGGHGGAGGIGGTGGGGGSAGDIFVISTPQNLSGAFVSGDFSYVNDGGSGGEGGFGGVGGRGGLGGHAGFKTSECDDASDGSDGLDGDPPGFANGPGSTTNQGAAGAHGQPKGVTFEPVKAGVCADSIPLPITVSGTLQPAELCRGFSTPASVTATLTGQNLAQVTAVTTNMANVTVAVKPSSTDTQLDLQFAIAGNSGLGAADLTLARSFGPSKLLAAAATIHRFEVLGIAPNSGARNNQVAVAITGNCFDPSAVIQQVNISGVGVNALNMLIVDEHTVKCIFDIGALAPQTARDVTVKTGVMQHTLLGGFTVT